MEQKSSFEEVLEKLQQSFPPEVVKQRQRNGFTSTYIEVDEYVDRLNTVVGNAWSWTLKGEPVLYDEELLMMGTLEVMGAKRDGIGTASIKRKGNSVPNLKYAARAASQDALRDACDLFGMGWANVKGHRHKQEPLKGEQRKEFSTCQKCKTPLSEDQITWLKDNHITLHFCENCVPAHLKKNK